MTAIVEALRWVQLVLFVTVGVWAVRTWLAQRRPAQAWLAATFGSLALVVVSAPVIEALEAVLPLAVTDAAVRVLIAVLAGFPYALLRLLDSFEPVARGARRVVGSVVGALAVAALVVPVPPEGQPWTPAFTVFALVLVGIWVVVLPSVGWRFWRSGAGQPTLVRRRLRLLAVAVATLGVAIVLAASAGSTPSPAIELATSVVSLVAAAVLLAGAVPPAWLRVLWRQPEERALHQAALGLMAAVEPDDIADVLVPHLRAVVAARGTVVVHRGRVLAADGRTDPEVATMAAAGVPGDVTLAEPVDVDDGTRVLRQPMSHGAIVVWTDRVTPFFAADELQLLARTALLADLALQRAELLASEREAREELAEANRELEAFVYSASHDLKSPLIAMLGYIDVLTEEHRDALGPDGGWYLERLVTNGRYMESLIRDLLELSRIGRIQMAREPVELGELIDGLVDELGQRHPHVTVTRDALPPLWANGTRLRQLFSNLLDNAARHGPADGVRVDIAAASAEDGGVELIVRDDGPGIPPAYRERVFGVFERLDPDETGGTGIGLAICRKVVETFGGRIWIGDHDRGAAFHIHLPATALVVPAVTTEEVHS